MADGKKTPWLKETSERSGFDNFNSRGKKLWTSVKQDNHVIAPDEYDTPPPSSRSLGGADISGSPRSNPESTSTPTDLNYSIQYITAAGGIAYNTKPWIKVVGSNQAVTVSSNPRISLAKQGTYVAIECVGSGVTLQEGQGLALARSATFSMTSGCIITLFCDRTSNLWRETSRTTNGGI